MAEQPITFKQGYRFIESKAVVPLLQQVESQSKAGLKAAEYVQIYDMVFKMCIQRGPYNFSTQLYQKFEAEIKKFCTTTVSTALKKAHSAADVPFLREWNQRWKNQKLVAEGLATYFTYLDRFHTANDDLILPLREKAFEIYKINVFDKYCAKASNAILNLIEKERREEDVDRELLRQAVLAFQEMGIKYNNQGLSIYKAQLETNIVSHAANFYRRTSRSWMVQDSAPNYLKKAEKMLAQEKARVEAYLNRNSTLEPLLNACHKEMLKAHQGPLLDKKTGLQHMLETDSNDDLARLYKLYVRFPADLEPISERFHAYICSEGKRIVVAAAENKDDANDAKSGLVSKLIGLHDRFEIVVTDCFDKSTIFQKSLKRAFETFINEDSSVAILLAKYVHQVLMKGSKITIQNANMESTLANIAYLYLYIHDKDVFERSYQAHLGRRLINDECENEHSEKAMIAKLKHGNYAWTNKLEGMFKDIQVSKQMLKTYLQGEGKRVCGNMQLEVNVCTPSFWPPLTNSYGSKSKALVPANIEAITKSFSEFYARDHKGKRLEWRHEQGKAELQVKFNMKTKRTLVCSTYQMLLLLIFNEATAPSYILTYEYILRKIGLPDLQIGYHLLSLCHPQLKAVNKRPGSIAMSESDQLRINPSFKSKRMRVIVPTMETPDAVKRRLKQHQQSQTRARNNQMDAAIVRIMKARKKMKHNVLIQEVLLALQRRFVPTPQRIKGRIEILINQEYLERDENHRGTYNYLP